MRARRVACPLCPARSQLPPAPLQPTGRLLLPKALQNLQLCISGQPGRSQAGPISVSSALHLQSTTSLQRESRTWPGEFLVSSARSGFLVVAPSVELSDATASELLGQHCEP
jgi:hypothetical protein